MTEKSTSPPKVKKEFGKPRSAIYTLGDFAQYDPDDLKIRKGNTVYEEMLKDDQVKAVISFKKHAVVSRPWFFKVENEEQQKVADYFNFMVKKMKGSFTDKLLGILSAIENGYSVSEKVFTPLEWEGKAMWGVEDIKLRPFETFDRGFIADKHGNLKKVQQCISAEEIEIPLPHLILFTHQPDKDPHYGESDLRACYRNWYSKDIIIKFQNIHLERHAGGFYWAKIEGQDLDPDDRKALEKALKSITAATGMIIPDGISLEHAMPVKTDSFERAVSQHDKGIAKCCLVPNLSGIAEQGSTGAYAQSQTQIEAFLWTINTINQRMEEILNEQMFEDLARYNFNTEDYPPFTFDPLSKAEKEILIKGYSELISKSAIGRDEQDEVFIRQVMGLPAKEVEADDGEVDGADLDEAVDPTTALNGAQVTALITIIERVTEGVLDKETASKIIASSFPLSLEDAQGMLKNVKKGTQPESDINKSDKNAGREELPENEDFIDKIGKEKFAASPWLQRVDFARTQKVMDSRDDMLGKDLASVIARAKTSIYDQVKKLVGPRSLGSIDPRELNGLSIPKNVLTELRKTIRSNLDETLNIGTVMARSELPKKVFAKLIQPGMDKTLAEKFLASRAMQITGVLDGDILKAVQNILYEGIKYDKSLKDTLAAMNQDTALLDLLPELDAAGRAVNVPARLENIARTNTADAINNSRSALFNKPEFEGFITAFEYSAIMDDRTSDICTSLNGKIRKDFGAYAPPNHYQCRSILIPVTVVDDWDGKQDKLPSIQPLEGFGKSFVK